MSDSTENQPPSQTLHEDDLLPLSAKDHRPADDPMGTVMSFVNAGLALGAIGAVLNVVGGVGGGAMPAVFDAMKNTIAGPAPSVGLSNTAAMSMPAPGGMTLG